jgi:uncharacterized protein
MNMKLLAGILLLALAFPVFSQDKQKVVFQVSDNDPAKWNLALNNARNVQADLGKGNVEIEIVAYGPGLAMLRMESPVSARLGISYVQAGVTHLMKRQKEGWAYIRP